MMATTHATATSTSTPAHAQRSIFQHQLAQRIATPVILWRVIGASACHMAVCVAWVACLSAVKGTAGLALGGLFPALRRGVGLQSWSWWLLALSLQMGMLPAVVACLACLDTRDALVSVGKYDSYFFVPRLVSSRLVKIAGRVSSVEGCVRQATGLAFRVVAGVVSLKAMVAMWAGGAGRGNGELLMAVACAVAHQAHCVYWSRDVLVFPSVERHRWVRWRSRLRAIGQRVVPVAVVACGWYAGLARVFGAGRGVGGVEGDAWTLVLGSVFAQIFFGANLLLLFSLGDSMVEIVMTERPRLGAYDSKKVLDAMQGCLDGKRGDIMSMLALYDLSLIPSDGLATDEQGEKADVRKDALKSKPAAVWRRQQIFADESGVLWSRMSGVCMDSLAGIDASVERVDALAAERIRKASAKGRAGAGAGASAGATTTKWNSMPARGALAGSEVHTEAVHSLLDIAGHHQAIVLSIRFLSDMAYVSVDEDRYGVLQLSEPSLGDILFMLLWVDHRVRQLTNWTQPGGQSTGQSIGGVRWRASGEELYSFRRVNAVLDVVRSEVAIALENLASAFGVHTLTDLLEANAQFKAVSASDRAGLKGVLARSAAS